MELGDLPPLIKSTEIDLLDFPQLVQIDDTWLHKRTSMGIDLSDLPPLVQMDDTWLHKRTDHTIETVEGLPGLEMDKAVSDTNQGLNCVQFVRVFMISGSSIVIPKSTRPSHGSPSKLVYCNPTLCAKAIAATYRIRMTYGQEDKEMKHFVATAFRVAPIVSLTARHCLQAEDNDAKAKLDLKEIYGCSTNPSLSEYFDKSSRMRFRMSSLSAGITWGEEVSAKGLYKTGFDVAFMRHERHGDQEFLLPCSPSYDLAGSHIVVVSFPDPQSFLRAAKVQLSSMEDTPIWISYKPAMGVFIAQAIRGMAEKMGVGEDDILASKELLRQVHTEAKQDLLRQLTATFGKFTSGSMVASIGTAIMEEGTHSCIGTTVSLLAGSSGGAVCCIALPGYFIGIHSGGSPGFDLNIATSTDSMEFCIEYMEKVLPRLPLPDSKFWSNVDLAPFLDWIMRHRRLIDVDSPWFEASKAASKKVIKNKAMSSKRARRG